MVIRRLCALLVSIMLAGCAGRAPPPTAITAPPPVEVQILAINDFHGNLLPSEIAPGVSQGGAAALGAALEAARTARTITVAAGDLIGATPLESAYFLDEPAIDALSLIGLDLASVGNHEFDKGARELWRMQAGGCGRFTTIRGRVPCRLRPFQGARFRYLAANVKNAEGVPIFPPTAIRQFGAIRIGFIGMTLKDTATLVTPAGVAGLSFTDEAATANALVPGLKAAGADAIVLLLHQGVKIPDVYRLNGCAGAAGALLPILDGLDPAIRTVVSGHTHNAYACEIDRGGARRLVTSAGKNGYFFSDLRLRFDPVSHALINQRAVNVPVPSNGAQQADVAAMVARTVAAARPVGERVVGRLAGPVNRRDDDLESPLADLVADSMLAAGRAKGARIALTNAAGVRTNLVPGPDGNVTFRQIFALMPFGNSLVVKTLSGTQLRAVLEQMFVGGSDGKPKVRSLLVPSRGLTYRYDLARPAGRRIVAMRLRGRAITPGAHYRVVVNNFLSSGGDGFSVLAQGAGASDAGLDLDALEKWLATRPAVPVVERISPSR